MRSAAAPCSRAARTKRTRALPLRAFFDTSSSLVQPLVAYNAQDLHGLLRFGVEASGAAVADEEIDKLAQQVGTLACARWASSLIENRYSKWDQSLDQLRES